MKDDTELVAAIMRLRQADITRVERDKLETQILLSLRPLISHIARRFQKYAPDDELLALAESTMMLALPSFDLSQVKTAKEPAANYLSMVASKAIQSHCKYYKGKGRDKLKALSMSIDAPKTESAKSLSDILPTEDSTEAADHTDEVYQTLVTIKPHLTSAVFRTVVLRYQGYSLTEIADILGLNTKQVDNCLSRLRKTLQDVPQDLPSLREWAQKPIKEWNQPDRYIRV